MIASELVTLSEGGVPQIPPNVMKEFRKVLHKTAMQGVNWYVDSLMEALTKLLDVATRMAETNPEVKNALFGLKVRAEGARKDLEAYRKKNNFKSMKRSLKVYFKVVVEKEDIAPYTFRLPVDKFEIKLAVSRAKGENDSIHGSFKRGASPVVDIFLGYVFAELDSMLRLADRGYKTSDPGAVMEAIKRLSTRVGQVEEYVLNQLAGVFSTLEHELIHFLQYETTQQVGLDRKEYAQRQEVDKSKSRTSRGFLKQSRTDYLTSPIEYKPWLSNAVNEFVFELERQIKKFNLGITRDNMLTVIKAFIRDNEFLKSFKGNDRKRKQVITDFMVALNKNPKFKELTKDLEIGNVPLESFNSSEELIALALDEFHKTAISRSTMSVPVRWMEEQGLLVGDVLDYGCGRGFDTEEIGATGYDPNSDDYSEEPEGTFDTVICVYVLNVVDEEERQEIISSVLSKLNDDGAAYFAVRRDLDKGSNGPSQWWVELPYDLVKETSTYALYKATKADAKNETIVKVKGGYRLKSHTGKNLGTYPTKAGDKKRERQVQYFKHVKS